MAKQISLGTFLAWIKERGEKQKFCYHNSKSGSTCGCPMIQFARKELRLKNTITASHTAILQSDWPKTIVEFSFDIREIIPNVFRNKKVVATYGELQKALSDPNHKHFLLFDSL